MNLKKKVITLAAVSAMSAVSLASAANIGLVNMNQVVSAYPGYGAIDLKIKAVYNNYGPKIQKEEEAISKLDKSKQEAAFNEKVVPLNKKANDEINTLINPMLTDIAGRVNNIRKAKGLDVVLDNPATLVSADDNSKIENITNDVIATFKK